MIDLVGRPYRHGADGSDGEIDCIHLVYTVLERLGIPTPPFDPDWYDAGDIAIARALLRWGRRVEPPTYDGDVAILPADGHFAVTWQNGLFYINHELQKVAWCPIGAMPVSRFFRTRSS